MHTGHSGWVTAGEAAAACSVEDEGTELVVESKVVVTVVGVAKILTR